MIRKRPVLRANTVLLLAALFLLLAANRRFWQVVAGAMPPAFPEAAAMAAATGVVLFVLIVALFLPLSFKPLFKPWIALLLLVAAGAGWFMQGYGAVMDRFAIQSLAETNLREGAEWLSWRMLWPLLGLWLLPTALLAWVRVDWRPWRQELVSRLKLAGACAVLLVLAIALQGRGLASTVRNHKQVRYLMNPVSVLSATLAYLHATRAAPPANAAPLGRDARREGAMAAGSRPVVLVVVVGESARASSFSLGGYARDTNPELARRSVVYFPDVHSCGTDTTVSLPCMFSNLGRREYDEAEAAASENLLDVLAHAGYRVSWFDNNTGSKDIARRVGETSVAEAQDPRYCANGCVDGILVERLRALLAQTDADRVVVLHTKGSHGPAYYLRYPPAFARFQPACTSNELQRCSREQIVNAYDNTILYTDDVIASAIDALQADTKIDSALLYVSDHGESTGEGGLYLHGAPYLIAPQSQTHIPMLLWLSDGFRARRGLDKACIVARRGATLSHDNLFDTVLGLLEVRTAAYRPALDALAGCATVTSAP